MKEKFQAKTFRAESLRTIERVNEIVALYQAQGYVLSLRQAYYQGVAKNWWENSEKSYKNLGALINDARLAGLVDWAAIEDRGREVVFPAHWASPKEIVQIAANQFRLDKWQDQDHLIVAMVEKQALEGVLAPVCRDLDVRFAANKGYGSASFFYEVGQLLRAERRNDKAPVVLYLGDHDPSGLDMTRDVQARLELFSRGSVEVRRLALNIDQVEDFSLPENPAKTTDSRAQAYIDRFGDSSWELDALDPSTLAGLVQDAVAEYRAENAWDKSLTREQKMRDELQAFARDYKEL